MDGKLDITLPESTWMVVANVVRQHLWGEGCEEDRSGTKHFKPGAKVYVVGDYPGMCETVTVIGQSRQGQYVTVSLPVWYLTRFRAKVVYSPAIIRRAATHACENRGGGSLMSENEVSQAIDKYKMWIAEEKKRYRSKGKRWVVVEE